MKTSLYCHAHCSPSLIVNFCIIRACVSSIDQVLFLNKAWERGYQVSKSITNLIVALGDQTTLLTIKCMANVLKIKLQKYATPQQPLYHDTCIQPSPKLVLQTKRRLFLLMKKRKDVCTRQVAKWYHRNRLYGKFTDYSELPWITNYLVALTLAALEGDSKDRQLPNVVCTQSEGGGSFVHS